MAASLMGCSTTTPKAQATPKTKIVYKDKIVYQDKIIYKYKTIYKDKIVYKEDPIDKKILFQTRMFLKIRLWENTNDSINYYSDGPDLHRSYDYTQLVALQNSKNAVLYDITLYNKYNPYIGN